MCAYASHMCLVLSDPKGVLDRLELELQMVVSYPVGAKNQTSILWKSTRCPYLPSSHCCPVVTIVFSAGMGA